MNQIELWNRYRQHLCVCDSIGFRLDVSRMRFDSSLLDTMAEPARRALDAMTAIEKGSHANVDEDRMVGHYWLRAPDLAPTAEIKSQIEEAVRAVKAFAGKVHSGAIAPQRGDGFFLLLVVGIGGSALGSQFISDALGTCEDAMVVRYVDNTDPDGIDRILDELDESLDQTLTVVISKSGRTVETRNGMLEVAAAYKKRGLDFHRHAVAVTSEGSMLFQQASEQKWLATFPMWDWVGGRTSVTSAVGLLPAALQGLDVDAFLAGAAACDVVTRNANVGDNPAMLLALMWHDAGGGAGRRNMVILPYRDRLALLGRYLQQLVMESIGKERDRDGEIVHQGLTVYGIKGSTDQHAFVQQLHEGPDDFFVMLIGVLRDRTGASIDVEPEVTAGDCLSGFLHGTRAALTEKERRSITLLINDLTARSVGALIALFERAVGFYAELVNVNAYHQPGVEAGKTAAASVTALQREVLGFLRKSAPNEATVEQIAEGIGRTDDIEDVYHVLVRATINGRCVEVRDSDGHPCDAKYRMA
ncbi:MAG: glucose-6-phosphate isomerase [Planctomycetes bacterium]|nr:glucose-6-phosphate isomerase [Planctomycetota bacterium]